MGVLWLGPCLAWAMARSVRESMTSLSLFETRSMPMPLTALRTLAKPSPPTPSLADHSSALSCADTAAPASGLASHGLTSAALAMAGGRSSLSGAEKVMSAKKRPRSRHTGVCVPHGWMQAIFFLLTSMPYSSSKIDSEMMFLPPLGVNRRDMFTLGRCCAPSNVAPAVTMWVYCRPLAMPPMLPADGERAPISKSCLRNENVQLDPPSSIIRSVKERMPSAG